MDNAVIKYVVEFTQTGLFLMPSNNVNKLPYAKLFNTHVEAVSAATWKQVNVTTDAYFSEYRAFCIHEVLVEEGVALL